MHGFWVKEVDHLTIYVFMKPRVVVIKLSIASLEMIITITTQKLPNDRNYALLFYDKTDASICNAKSNDDERFLLPNGCLSI